MKHGLFYLLAQALPAVAAIITLAFYTRYLSTADYGLYSIILAIATTANIILFNWLHSGVYRFWNEGKLSKTQLQQVVLFALILISILVVLVGVLIGLLTGLYQAVSATVSLLICGAFFTTYQRINAIKEQSQHYLWVESLRVILASTVGMLLVWYGFSWQGIVIASCIAFVTVLFYPGRFSTLFQNSALQTLDNSLLKRLLQYGLPLSATFVLLEVIRSSDRLMLGKLIGPEAAGQYAAAWTVPQYLVLMLAHVISLALYPGIIRTLESSGATTARVKLEQYILIFTGLVLPIAAGLVIVRYDFVPLLLGSAFVEPAITLIPWLSGAMVLNVYYLFYVSYAFQLSHQTGAAVRVVLVAALLNIVLNSLLIPKYGTLGAALSTLIAYAISVIYGYQVGNNYFPIHIAWKSCLQVVLAVLCMSLLLSYLPLNHGWQSGLARMVVGIVVYGGLLLVMNVGDIRSHLFQYIQLSRGR